MRDRGKEKGRKEKGNRERKKGIKRKGDIYIVGWCWYNISSYHECFRDTKINQHKIL